MLIVRWSARRPVISMRPVLWHAFPLPHTFSSHYAVALIDTMQIRHDG